MNQTEPPKQRFLALDIFRGFTITAMVFVNSIGAFASTPNWLLHAEDVGLTVTDLIAPFFIIAISLTYKMSWEKYKKKEGKINAFVRFLRRYAAFVGLGFIGGISMDGIQPMHYWGVLQAIGLAGIFTLLFIEFNRIARLIICIIWLVAYQYLLETFFGNIVFEDIHGGFYGGFSWGIMMLLGTVVADYLSVEKMKDYLVYGITFVLIGAILHFIFVETGFTGISKERVSSSYVLVSTGVAALLIYGMFLLYETINFELGKEFFEVQSKNALFLYLIHSPVYGLISLAFPYDSPFALVLLFSTLSIIAVWYIGKFMDDRSVYIRF